MILVRLLQLLLRFRLRLPFSLANLLQPALGMANSGGSGLAGCPLPQSLHEQTGQRFQVLLAKRGDGIVIGMLIGRQIAKADIVIGGVFDPARTGDAQAVCIEQQPRHLQLMICR